MYQLPNESTKLLNILFKNLCEWYCMLNYNRKIDTIWNSLFDDKSSYLRCIQDVVIKFASAINITQTYLTTQLPISVWMPESSLIMNISGYFRLFICYIIILKLPSNSDTMLSYSCPFEDKLSIYSVWLFDIGKWAIPEKKNKQVGGSRIRSWNLLWNF